ncbi:MAG: hypothetical protein ACRDLZ_08730, partial [Gaiellaceae bacterium]
DADMQASQLPGPQGDLGRAGKRGLPNAPSLQMKQVKLVHDSSFQGWMGRDKRAQNARGGDQMRWVSE